jgi:hypothetical protein
MCHFVLATALLIGFSFAVSVPAAAQTTPGMVTIGSASGTDLQADGSFTIAQTNGMDRRQDRRDTRQDCRQQEGAVGADKRNCKQEGRQQSGGG